MEMGTQANLENWATAEKLVCSGGHVFEWLRFVEPQDSGETAAGSAQGEEEGTGKSPLTHLRAAGLWTEEMSLTQVLHMQLGCHPDRSWQLSAR